MLSIHGGFGLKAAEKLEVRLEDMTIPISIKELSSWVDGLAIPSSVKDLSNWVKDKNDSDLAAWLDLLDFESRTGLVKLLKAPLVKDRSMARQLLRSWAGRKLLDEVSDLIRLDDDSTGQMIYLTLENLLEKQSQVSTLDLVKALPVDTIYLDLDAFLKVANSWREELQNQQNLVLKLGIIPSTENKSKENFADIINVSNIVFNKYKLTVNHRREELEVEVCNSSDINNRRDSWIVLMPGLGGTKDHFRWLANDLCSHNWPVVLLQHPGSDAEAVKALLEGRRPLPGAEVIPDRLEDLNELIKAKEEGMFSIEEEEVVLIGHSLGALTAFFASGATLEDGLDKRCQKALDALSLTNLSQLLQCQMINVSLPKAIYTSKLKAIVAINSFGSLLWPSAGSANIPVPVLLAGGTYDLITPALTEQLSLLLSTIPNDFSRTLLVEGASHFSPIRVQNQIKKIKSDDLFQLGEALVGVQPFAVQNLLGTEIIRFLDELERGDQMDTFIGEKKEGLYFHVLDRSMVEYLLEL